MTRNNRIIIGVLAAIIAIGAIDLLLIEKDWVVSERKKIAEQEEPYVPVLTIDEPNQVIEPTEAGIRKRQEINVLNVLQALEFEAKETDELTLIKQIIPNDLAQVHVITLLKDGDRAGSVAWSDSMEVKTYFLALKEALHTTFSPHMKDLVDETQQREGKPTRNMLTFKDPFISEERIVFVRIRERIYEFHVAEGMDDEIFELVETVSE